MSADNDGKAETPAAGSKPATKTVVGVPALPEVPPDRPSDMEMTRQLPPKSPVPEEVEGERRELPSTALDVKAISSAEAERMLAWTGFTQDEISTAHAGAPPKAGPTPRTPGVAGALPKPAPRPAATTAMKTLPPAADMFVGLGRTGGTRQPEPEKPTRPGVAAQAGVSIKGRATLLLDSSAPPVGETSESDATLERAPIVVPGAGTTPPKAVTQAPPWGEGAAHVGAPIPKGATPMREREPSIEEISSSMLLPDASGEAPAAGVEELSGSVLIEDAPDGRGAPVVTKVVSPSAHPSPRAKPSVKPPVPKSTSSRPPEVAHRMLLGMPELPKSTPAPNLDFLATAPSAPVFPATMPAVIVAPDPAPPPPPPIAPMTGDIELTRLPRGGLEPVFDVGRKAQAALRKAFEQLRASLAANGGLGADGRPKWFLPVVAVAGLIVGVGLFAFIGALIRGGGDSARASTGTKPSARPSATASLGTRR